MARFATLLAFFLLVLAPPAPAFELTSVSPATIRPGAPLTLTGGPFGPQTRIVLGDLELRPDSLNERRMSVTVPPLPEGEYRLFLRDGKVETPALSLTIPPPTPQITSLSPTTLDECSPPAARTVTVRGNHFAPGASLLLDGSVVAAGATTTGEFTFSVPAIAGGIHQLQVINPDGKASIPHALFIDSTPEIIGVSQGTDNVTSYDLIIRGKNFLFSSILSVDGREVFPARQTTVAKDYIRYLDCQTLIFRRFPYSQDLKRVTLQIINPGGRESPVFAVTIP